jgi:hypothetical protein
MSTHYIAYFHLKSKIIDSERLKTFLDDYQLQYEDRISHFVFEEGILLEESDNTCADWQQFIKEINEMNRSVNAGIIHEESYMDLGFITDKQERWAVFDISARNLDELIDEVLKPKSSDMLHFLISLYQAVEADAMVWGAEYDFETALAFLGGTTKTSEYIGAAFGTALPETSLELLRVYEGYNISIGEIKGYACNAYHLDQSQVGLV